MSSLPESTADRPASGAEDIASTEALGDRIASLRERMATLESSIGVQTPASASAAPVAPVVEAPPAPSPHRQPAPAPLEEPAPSDDEAGIHDAPAPVAVPPEARSIRVEPAPGVDPNDPVLALGVADPDALDAWLTDEIAVVDPNATGEMEPVTAEMHAVTKPAVYNTLAPTSEGGSGSHLDSVTVEPVSTPVDPYPTSDAQRWITLLVVAVVLIGMGVALALWLSSQPDASGAAILTPFSNT